LSGDNVKHQREGHASCGRNRARVLTVSVEAACAERMTITGENMGPLSKDYVMLTVSWCNIHLTVNYSIRRASEAVKVQAEKNAGGKD
jgi:hypothetical protein